MSREEQMTLHILQQKVRENEMLSAAKVRYNDESDENQTIKQVAFLGGVEWADAHPRKGLVDVFIAEKVYCKMICGTVPCCPECDDVKKYVSMLKEEMKR